MHTFCPFTILLTPCPFTHQRNTQTYPTNSSPTFEAVVKAFLDEDPTKKPEAASLAIAGAVVDNVCDMTNCPWIIDGQSLEEQFGFRCAFVLTLWVKRHMHIAHVRAVCRISVTL